MYYIINYTQPDFIFIKIVMAVHGVIMVSSFIDFMASVPFTYSNSQRCRMKFAGAVGTNAREVSIFFVT